MNLDLAQAFEHTQSIIQTAPSVRHGMELLLDYCASQAPSAVWAELLHLDFEQDSKNLHHWLQTLNAIEPPPAAIVAFWFGLFNTGSENTETGCELYVAGSPQFDPNTAEWAVWNAGTYLPQGRYAASEVLPAIFAACLENDVAEIGEYVLCLGYAALTVKSIWPQLPSTLRLGEHGPRAVVVGFDEGDFVQLEGV